MNNLESTGKVVKRGDKKKNLKITRVVFEYILCNFYHK